jgi:predicted transcriptional regulator
MQFDILQANSEKGLTMTVKDQVRKIIDQMPEECTVEDVQHQLYLIGKVQKGLKSIDEGRGIPHEDVRRQFASWRTK